jgi:hypothetical protein
MQVSVKNRSDCIFSAVLEEDDLERGRGHLVRQKTNSAAGRHVLAQDVNLMGERT